MKETYRLDLLDKTKKEIIHSKKINYKNYFEEIILNRKSHLAVDGKELNINHELKILINVVANKLKKSDYYYKYIKDIQLILTTGKDFLDLNVVLEKDVCYFSDSHLIDTIKELNNHFENIDLVNECTNVSFREEEKEFSIFLKVEMVEVVKDGK
jgi:hypothetical protein